MTFFQINYFHLPGIFKRHILLILDWLGDRDEECFHAPVGGIVIGCDSDTKSVKCVSRETHSLASSLTAGFWLNADIITSEEAEEVKLLRLCP